MTLEPIEKFYPDSRQDVAGMPVGNIVDLNNKSNITAKIDVTIKSGAFKSWCIVQLMGHQEVAGLVSEYEIAGIKMLKIAVPETKRQKPYTQLFSTQAVYSLYQTDEETVLLFCDRNPTEPVHPWKLDPITETDVFPAKLEEDDELPF